MVAEVGLTVTAALAAFAGTSGRIVNTENIPDSNSNAAVVVESSLVSLLRTFIYFRKRSLPD